MPTVHPTAVIDGEIRLADDVQVGPACVLTGPIEVGPGCRLIGHAYLQGPLCLGPRNTVYPFACLGFPPQDLKWDPMEPGAGLVVGEGNVFREHVSVHRATSRERPTTVGDGNYFMACSHAGHDAQIGSRCIFANSTLLGGHVQVGDRVVAGGNSSVHQFCRLGRGSMLSGNVATSQDLPPFFMLTGINIAGSLNMIGLRRSGASQAEIADARWVYTSLYRRDMSLKAALEVLRERADRPMVAEYIRFIESSKRGICPAVGSGARGVAAAGGSDRVDA